MFQRLWADIFTYAALVYLTISFTSFFISSVHMSMICRPSGGPAIPHGLSGARQAGPLTRRLWITRVGVTCFCTKTCCFYVVKLFVIIHHML